MDWEILTIAIILLFLIYLWLLKWDKKQTIKLRREYDAKKDISRRTTIPDEKSVGRVIRAEPVVEGNDESEGRQLLPIPDDPVVTTDSKQSRTKKKVVKKKNEKK